MTALLQKLDELIAMMDMAACNLRAIFQNSIIALFFLSSQSQAAKMHADLVVRHATVIDVEHARSLADQAVVVSGGDIVDTGPDTRMRRRWRGVQSVDAHGRFLMPGLWDMHVHFGGGPDLIAENEALLPLYVAHGITTVRDCSGDLPTEVLRWREEIKAGQILGPQLFSSGAKLEGIHPVWKGTIEVGNRVDVDAALARLLRDRVDFVKITDSTIDPALFLYALSQAHQVGLRSSGHIPMALTVSQAVTAGLSSIEHMDYAYKAGVKDESTIAADFAAGRIDRAEANQRIRLGFDSTTAEAAYRDLARRGVAVTPTLNGMRIIAWLDSDSHENDPYLAYIGPGLRKTYEWRVRRADQANGEEIIARHQNFYRLAAVLPMLQRAGVSIMAGTDAGFLNSFDYPGIGLHDELTLFVKYGLTPAQALVAAIRSGPAWFGKLDRYGGIERDKAADMVLLETNPLRHIEATRTIFAVIMRGHVYDRAALDSMLNQAKSQVTKWNALARTE